MKLLFACVPADGHFGPLTGLAVHLRSEGHDVRWYTGPSYAKKLASLGVPHFPFVRSTDLNGENLTEHFPDYAKLGLGPKAIAFALEKIFFGNLEAQYRDMCEIAESFPFEGLVFDGAFYAAPLVGEKLGVPCFVIAPAPSPAPTSRHSPPPFFGLKPARTPIGKVRDLIVNAMVESTTKGGMKIFHELRAREGLRPYEGSIFDIHVSARALFMLGVPEMDFPRDDWPANVHFVGPLVAHKKPGGALPDALEQKLTKLDSMIVVSQGTIDNRDPDKLFVPSLTALSGTRHLVVVTTGGRHTPELRARFTADNVMIEDWIDFDLLLARASLFICNGGYGSVMQALKAGVPILAAGKLEGKNDINARLDYCGLALDLRTERPSPKQITKGVARVLGDPKYRANVTKLKGQLASYQPFELISKALASPPA